LSRWCNASFDVLYTSFERDGAIAEAYALLASQPVFPSKPDWFVHSIAVACGRVLRLADLEALSKLGVDAATFRGRDYGRTREIADAAYFLDFDGLIVPSARWSCTNFIIFTDKVRSESFVSVKSEEKPIDWASWRANRAK